MREFPSASEIPEDSGGALLTLFVLGSGPEPTVQRLDLRRDVVSADAMFRSRCRGWGLIGIHFGDFFEDRELRFSTTNHNTEKRAVKWAGAFSDLGDPGAWDWPAVTRASGQLNRMIRAMAVRKIGSHPVLPQAAQLIARAGLHHEYGTGIHAMESPGMLGRQHQ